MLFLITLAWKNLFRYRRRTIITSIAIAFGIALFIFMDSWLIGADRESQRNLVQYETSSIRLMTKDYWDEKKDHPLDKAIPHPEKAVKILEEKDIKWAPRVNFIVEATGFSTGAGEDLQEKGTVRALAMGVDLDKELAVFGFDRDKDISAGRFFKQGEEAVVGNLLAEKLGIKKGDKLNLLCRNRFGSYEDINVEVVGILKSPNQTVNRTAILLPLQVADFYLQMEGLLTEINLHIPEHRNVEEVEENLNQDLEKAYDGKVQAYSWKKLAASYIALAEQKKSSSQMILFIIFIIAAVGITNTMMMSIMERVRETGMMRAMGMTEGKIKVLFVLEGLGIGFFGSAAGTIIGVVVNIFMVEYGIDFTWLMTQMDIGYRITGAMKSAWSIETILSSFFAGIFISLIVSAFTVRKATKKTISQSLRHQ